MRQVCATQGFSRTHPASRMYPLVCAETRPLSTSQLLEQQPESSCNPTVASHQSSLVWYTWCRASTTHAECDPTTAPTKNPATNHEARPLRRLPPPTTPTTTRHRRATPPQDSYVASPRAAFSLIALANMLPVCRRAATCLQKQQTP